MTTITWIIEWMNASTTEINGHTEVVLTAGWRCNGTDGTYSGTAYGSCSFPQPETGGSFTPYAQLTQDQVLGWCWSNGVDKTATEENVDAQIQNQINPPVIQPPLPWTTA
jgi:hypothetical protein